MSDSESVCTNIYKTGECTTIMFTEKWIELINKIERNKTQTCKEHDDKMRIL